MNTLVQSFYMALFILAGKKPYHISLDEFWQDSVTDCRVSCPQASEKSINSFAITLAATFLIESSLLL